MNPAGQQTLCEAHPAGRNHAAVRGLIFIYNEHAHEERPAGRGCAAVRGLILYATSTLVSTHRLRARAPPFSPTDSNNPL